MLPTNRIFTQAGQSTVVDQAGTSGPAAGVPAVVVILVPDPAQQAAWQQIYRLASERARQSLQPPRHHERFFSVWN
jgi:hypothetical protein